jgi:hypothetical protein
MVGAYGNTWNKCFSSMNLGIGIKCEEVINKSRGLFVWPDFDSQ